MMIEVNGERIEISNDCKKITDLLVHFGLENKMLIIELNKQILEKSDHDKTYLSDGDRVEIVHFVGGG